MERKTKKLVVVVLAAIIIVSAVFVIYQNLLLPANPMPDGEPPLWQVKFTGNVEQEKTLTINELAEMPLTSVVVKVDGKNVTYKGVTLFEFCNCSGMLWDTGPVNVISENGQTATLNIFQAWNSTAYPYFQDSNRITLVFIKDGEWMTQEMGGPVKLIAPYFSEDYQIEQVSEVNTDFWTISISGLVGNPITISSKNMTAFEEVTVEAEFVPGDGKRTSNWTGLSMMDVLEAAEMPYNAVRITVVAVDDYCRNYTRYEITESNMMIGYQENGEPLPQTKGGPFRLYLPIDKYKWAQFWVKFVTQIIVS
jgi:DMSO/TMAO reductase YedYZ molybdopterin-dependent catalytic subunit